MFCFIEPGSTRYLLVRLEHLFQIGEHSTWSQPASVDLQALLSSYGPLSYAREVALGANSFADEVERLSWNGLELNRGRQLDGFVLELGPFEIATVVVGYTE